MNKVIIIILLAVVVAGGGFYFFVVRQPTISSNITDTSFEQTNNNQEPFPVSNSRPASQPSTSQQPSTVTNPQSAFNFHCKDLLPDADFQRITKYSPQDYPVEESSSISNGYPLRCAWQKGNIDQIFQFGVKVGNLTLWPGQKQLEISQYGGISVPNLGSDAYSSGNIIYWLSSNKKYAVDIWVTLINDSVATKQTRYDLGLQLAKVIDANLNNY